MTPVRSTATGTTTHLLQGSTWEAEAYRRALALKDMPDDWDRPRSRKPTILAVNAALTYIQRVAGLELFAISSPFIAPMSNGGVQLEWSHGQRQLEIELLPDGAACFVTSAAGDVTEGDLGDASSPDVKSLFGWLAATP